MQRLTNVPTYVGCLQPTINGTVFNKTKCFSLDCKGVLLVAKYLKEDWLILL